MPTKPKLRGRSKRRNSPYNLGEIPATVATAIGSRIVHRLAVGSTDITGDDFGEIFAQSINAQHRQKPLGIADVVWEGCAWSVKTVQDPNPFTASNVRVISGRNNVNFSCDIKNPFADMAATGECVLNIWNGRIDEAATEYDDLRIFVIVRNMSRLEFTLFEMEAQRYVPSEYKWSKTDKGNLQAHDIQRKEHRFTWQVGNQFTIKHHIPASAYRFRIKKRPPMIALEHVLRLSRYEDSWIEPVTLEAPPAIVDFPPFGSQADLPCA